MTVMLEERQVALIDKQSCLPQALLGFDRDKTAVCCLPLTFLINHWQFHQSRMRDSECYRERERELGH